MLKKYFFIVYRSLKAEKERYQQEMEFQLKIMEMENQRKFQEQEHEMRIFSLLIGNNMQNPNATHQVRQYRPQTPENFGGFPHHTSFINHSTPLNVSDSSSETSSSTNIEDGLHYYSL